jgi:hypothetical protein
MVTELLQRLNDHYRPSWLISVTRQSLWPCESADDSLCVYIDLPTRTLRYRMLAVKCDKFTSRINFPHPPPQIMWVLDPTKQYKELVKMTRVLHNKGLSNILEAEHECSTQLIPKSNVRYDLHSIHGRRKSSFIA